MNVMQPMYDAVSKTFGQGHTTLGVCLLIGECMLVIHLKEVYSLNSLIS